MSWPSGRFTFFYEKTRFKEGSMDLESTGGDSEKPVSLRRKLLFPCVALGLILCSIYSNSLDCAWHLDDFHSITQNSAVQLKSLTWEGIYRSLHADPKASHKLYRPVAGLSFAVNYFLSGTNPFSYHMVNLFIHWVTSVFLFLFIYRTLKLPVLAEKYQRNVYAVGLLAATLWAVNPVQAQAVTYVVQRMASLAGMFFVISLTFYAMGRTARDKKWSLLYCILCVVAFLLAFGSKENAVLLPLTILLYEAFLVQPDLPAWFKRNKIHVLVAVAAVLAIGLLFLSYRSESVFSFVNGYEGRTFTLSQRLLTQSRVIVFYLSLLFYPVPGRLNVAHSFEISTSLFNPLSTLFAVLCIAGGIVLAVIAKKKYPIPAFAFLFFVLNHLLESSVFPLEMIFEHRNYIPSMLIFLPVSVGICTLLDRYKRAPGMKAVLAAFVTLLLIGLGHATYVRNFAWKTEESLWLDAAKKAPDEFRPHHNLGIYYQGQGRLDLAISEFEKALASPGFSRKREKSVAFYHLGKVYQDLGEIEKAKENYEAALRLEPSLSHALLKLAVLYDMEGDESRAERYLQQAFDADPGNAYVRFNMGLHKLKQGKSAEAVEHFMRAVENEELRQRSSLYLGIAHKQLGHFGPAISFLRLSLDLNAANITPHLHLMEIYQAKGLDDMACDEAETLVSRFMSQPGLLEIVISLVLEKGHLRDVDLSGKRIFPLLQEALRKENRQILELNALVDKALQSQDAVALSEKKRTTKPGPW